MAGVVVNDEGQILVIRRRDNGEWQPPGGVLELDESIEDGLRREVLEETGIEIGIGPLTGVYKNMRLGVVALVFRCTADYGTLRTSDETVAVQWMHIRQVEGSMSPAFAVRVRDALDTSPGVRLRFHNGQRLLGAQTPTGQPASTTLESSARVFDHVTDTIAEIEAIRSQITVPAGQSAVPKIYSAAALARSIALLRCAADLIRTGQHEAIGVVCRTAWETWLIGHFILIGGDESLFRLAAESIRNKSNMADRNQLGSDIQSRIQTEQSDIESAERRRLEALGTPHPEAKPLTFGRLTVEAIATEVDNHFAKLDPTDRGSVLQSYNLLYRAHSTFDNHGLPGLERFINLDEPGQLSISPDPPSWINPNYALGIVALHVSQLAILLCQEFSIDCTRIESAQAPLIEGLRAIGKSAVVKAEADGLPGDWQRFK